MSTNENLTNETTIDTDSKISFIGDDIAAILSKMKYQVLYTPQSLTTSEQEQARKNIKAQKKDKILLYSEMNLSEADKENARNNIQAASLSSSLDVIARTNEAQEETKQKFGYDEETLQTIKDFPLNTKLEIAQNYFGFKIPKFSGGRKTFYINIPIKGDD